MLRGGIGDDHLVDAHTSDCDFEGGWVGFCGFELKAEVHADPVSFQHTSASSTDGVDAGWIFLDRFMLFDHRTETLELVFLGERGDNEWFDEMRTLLLACEE